MGYKVNRNNNFVLVRFLKQVFLKIYEIQKFLNYFFGGGGGKGFIYVGNYNFIIKNFDRKLYFNYIILNLIVF